MKILSICGSPRKGNSEAVINYLAEIFKEKGIENEVVLLREKKIGYCRGCVEFCNKELRCHLKDDFPELMKKFDEADRLVLVSPIYFNMPPGIFKNFIDRCCVFYTAEKAKEFARKKAIIISIGADEVEHTQPGTNNLVNNFCRILNIPVVGTKNLRGRSELKGKLNDIFENDFNPGFEDDLRQLIQKLVA